MEKELIWLKECHSQVLQQSLKDLESAFKNFFQQRTDFIRKLNTSLAHPSDCRQSRHLKRNAFFPRFKKKGVKERFRFPQGCKIEQKNDRLYLPKIGWVRYRNSREIVGKIKNVTVSMKCGSFFVSIQTEFEQEIPMHKGGEIGIDMGITVALVK